MLPTATITAGTPAIPPLLASLRAVAYAVMTSDGRLLAANEGFHHLMRQRDDALTNVAPHIVNPPFAELARAEVDAGTVLYRGLITFLDSDGQSRSLVGVIYRHGEHIELVGEHDVAEQERLFATVMQLNDELAEQQREVVRANRELKRQHDAINTEVAQRLAVEAELRAEKAEQAALLEKLTTAQNQLLQAEKMASIGQLAAGVAHEINNPIGFVSSNLNSLGEYFDDLLAIIAAYARADALIAREPVLAAIVKKAREDCDYDFVCKDCATLLAESRDGLARVTRIVQDLKSYSRVDESIWQEADLNACMDSTLNVARHELKDKAEVVREYGVLPPVLCCPGQLNQVFMNLIINAVQALDKPGRITVRSGQVGDFVWVDVEDSGKGIAPEQVRRVFEPFFTTKPVGQGTGLGLSLCWNIIKTHGGRIDVDSQLGHGARFRIWVPVRPPGGHSANQNIREDRAA
jgi:signal transduction histidine kinase